MARTDLMGRSTSSAVKPLCVFGGFQIASEDWTRGEDGWDCDYETLSPTVYPTEAECWAAIEAMPTSLALAQSAVTESIIDNGGATDWFGLATALTDARVRDLKAGVAR